jgi:hypothetical protein
MQLCKSFADDQLTWRARRCGRLPKVRLFADESLDCLIFAPAMRLELT